MPSNNISVILDDWYKAKLTIKSLEKRIERHKKILNRYMDVRRVNSVSNNDYVLVRRVSTRETVSKKDMSPELWNRFAKKTRFPSFYVSKKRM